MEPLTLAASRRSVAAGTSSQSSTTPSSAPGSTRAELPAPRRRSCFLARCRTLRSMPALSPAELRPRQRLGTECGTARHSSARLGAGASSPPRAGAARRHVFACPKGSQPWQGRRGPARPAPRHAAQARCRGRGLSAASPRGCWERGKVARLRGSLRHGAAGAGRWVGACRELVPTLPWSGGASEHVPALRMAQPCGLVQAAKSCLSYSAPEAAAPRGRDPGALHGSAPDRSKGRVGLCDQRSATGTGSPTAGGMASGRPDTPVCCPGTPQ